MYIKLLTKISWADISCLQRTLNWSSEFKKIFIIGPTVFELQTGSVTGFVAGESAHEVELLLAKKNQIVKILFNAVKFNLENSIYLLNKLFTEDKFTLKNYLWN